jgi:hypothetical protein
VVVGKAKGELREKYGEIFGKILLAEEIFSQ